MARFDDVAMTPHIPTEGDPVGFEMCNLSLLHPKTLAECPELEKIVACAWKANPCSQSRPWSLIVGFDEYTPGNKFKQCNARKAMDLGFNFVELGQMASSREATWMIPVSVRHSTIVELGGWSRIMRHVLRLLLLGSSGLETAGMPVFIDGAP